MIYTLIKGSYHIVSHSPDADSIKFRADNPDLWKRINTEYREMFEKALMLEGGVVTLRLQGVDAVETHYAAPKPPAPDDLKGKTSAALKEPALASYKQPGAMGRAATDKFLELLGFTQVKWRKSFRGSYVSEARVAGAVVKEQWKDPLHGYIVTGDVERNGRPITWAFPGKTTLADGATITTEQLAEMAEQSANYQLLRLGMIHPLYFMTLAGKLRQKLDKAVQEAQAAARKMASTSQPTNIWQLDRSTTGVNITSLSVITDEQIIYPDLFRRILRHHMKLEMMAYWEALRANASSITPQAGLSLNRLFEGANPYVFVISDQDFVRLADIIEISGTSIRMKKSPHDLVFLS
jgi:hypothetical protein